MKLEDILKKVSGYENLDSYNNEGMIDTWQSWWKGKVADFHNYSIFNGKRRVKQVRMSLNMAKKSAEDWANLLINEKTDITLSDAQSQKVLEDIFTKTKFWRKANEGVEKSFALGMGAFVVSVDNISTNEDGTVGNDGEIKLVFCPAKKIRPITIEDGEITECAFINVSTNKTSIAIHLKDEYGNYVIHNITANGTKEDNLTLNEDSYYSFNTNNNIAWFSIIKPNIANNLDVDSPLGISIFANAIDTLKEIDLIYDSYATEFNLGKKRVFTNAEDVTIDTASGEVVNAFDSNDISFYFLPSSPDGKLIIQRDSDTLRVAEHSQALQTQLDIFSYLCGFGGQHYKFTQGTITTATQVISENSEMFRNKKKHEILIEEFLLSLVKCLIYVSNTFTPNKINENVDISIKFDDSIIEDKESQKASDRLDVASGIMPRAEYRAKWYNEDLKTAKKIIDEIENGNIIDDEPVITEE